MCCFLKPVFSVLDIRIVHILILFYLILNTTDVYGNVLMMQRKYYFNYSMKYCKCFFHGKDLIEVRHVIVSVA